MTWTPEQYQQLTERYRDASDTELLRLAKTPDDLTDVANEVLQKELAARNLHAPGSSAETPLEDDEDGFERRPDFSHFAEVPDHCLLRFQSLPEANEACATLAQAGIISQIRYTPLSGFDQQVPLLAVQPETLEAACSILNRIVPVPYDPDAKEPGDFVTPPCPSCNAADPILMAIDPINHWLCEACEHEWDEVEPAQ